MTGRPRSVRWRAVALGVLLWLVLPVFCVRQFVEGGAALAGHVDAVPAGTRGVYVVTSHSCRNRLCITGGTFTSDDRRITARDLLGDYRWQLGQAHRVVYDVDAAEVVPLPSRWDWSSTVLGMTGALGYLVFCAVALARLAERRRAPSPADLRVPAGRP